MQPREIQAVSALAVFLTAALPAAAGAVAFRAQPVLVAAVTGDWMTGASGAVRSMTNPAVA